MKDDMNSAKLNDEMLENVSGGDDPNQRYADMREAYKKKWAEDAEKQEEAKREQQERLNQWHANLANQYGRNRGN